MSDNIIHLYDKNTVAEEASDWIVRFDGDRAMSQQDISEFKAWVARSPMHKQLITQYASLWNDMDLLSELMLAAPKKTKATVAHSAYSSQKRVKASWWQGSMVLGGGALALVFCAVMIFGAYSRFIHYPSTNGVYVTSTGETQSITLSDNSVIWLNTASRVEVDYNSKQRRIVLLDGEAHFQVAKNPDQAFEVYAGGQMVKAVGTAFSVYKKEDTVSVTVTEGRVDLVMSNELLAAAEPESSPPSIVSDIDGGEKAKAVTERPSPKVLGSLVAGQSIKLPVDAKGRMDDMVTLEAREIDQALAWREGLLIFSGESLAEVVQEVSRYSNIQIAIANPNIRSMRIGGQFKIGETDALFDVLENGFGLRVSRLDPHTVEIHARQ